MTTIADFITRCDAYCGKRSITSSYLSRLLFNDGKVLGSLRRGADITLRRLSKAEEELLRLESALAPDHAAP